MRSTAAIFLILLSLVGAGCSSNDDTVGPDPSTPSNFSGQWNGTFTLNGAPVNVNWTLTQNGAAVTGPARMVLTDGTVLMNGTLNGTAAAITLTFTIALSPGGIPAQPACTGQLQGSMFGLGALTSMSGSASVTSATCTPPLTDAQFTLIKS